MGYWWCAISRLPFLLLVLLLFGIPSVHATEALCGPNPVLAPTEYCAFHPFIKAGENDAIIMLSWDALGPGMRGVPTPSMVGEYYFYSKDGNLYYLGNTTGAEELFYTFHEGLWYLSDGRAIDPEGPCILKNITPPEEIRDELCPCGNVSIKSPSYPVSINGSRLYASNGAVSYTIEVPGDVAIPALDNVTLRAVFLRKGVLIYTWPKNPFVLLDWGNVTVLYYDGSSLQRLNFTKALGRELPACPLSEEIQKRPLEFYGVLFVGIALVLVVVYWRMRR